MQAQEESIQVCLWHKGPQCPWDAGGQLQGPHRCGGKKGTWVLRSEGDNSPAAVSLHLVVPGHRDGLRPGATPDGFRHSHSSQLLPVYKAGLREPCQGLWGPAIKSFCNKGLREYLPMLSMRVCAEARGNI